MDMLIALHALPALANLATQPGVVLRTPIGPRYDLVTGWDARQFMPNWASEARADPVNRPVSLLIATRSEPAEVSRRLKKSQGSDHAFCLSGPASQPRP